MFIFAINIVVAFVIFNLLIIDIVCNNKSLIKYKYKGIFCKASSKI